MKKLINNPRQCGKKIAELKLLYSQLMSMKKNQKIAICSKDFGERVFELVEILPNNEIRGKDINKCYFEEDIG